MSHDQASTQVRNLPNAANAAMTVNFAAYMLLEEFIVWKSWKGGELAGKMEK